MKKLTWTHIFFGLFGLIFSSGVFFFSSSDSAPDQAHSANGLLQESVAFLLLQPANNAVNLRQQPQLDSPVVGAVSPNGTFEVTEDCTTTLSKVGQPGQWLKGRTADGVEGYTAAWLYTVAGINQYTTTMSSSGAASTTVTTSQSKDAALAACQDVAAQVAAASANPVTLVAAEVPASALADRAPVDVESALLVKPLGQENVNVRDLPVMGSVVSIVPAGVAVEVIDPLDEVLSKVGAADGWIRVRTAEGVEGYTAAWLFTWVDVPTTSPATAAPDEVLKPLVSGKTEALYITPKSNQAINVRAAPFNGAVVDTVSPGTSVLVTEPADVVLAKVGVEGEWLQVRTARGAEGYTAANLYTLAEVEASPVVELAPLLPASQADTGFLPAPETAEFYEPNSVTALGIIPSLRAQDTLITPIGSSITTLNVNTLEELAAAPAVDDEIVPLTGFPLIPVEGQSAAITDTEGSPDIPATIGTGKRPEVKPVNNIIPISVAVTGPVGFETAELAINNQPVTRFFEEPYEYAFDTSQLDEGTYRLTFTVVSAENMLYADEIYFDLAFDSQGPVSDAAAVQRVVMIDGQKRPLSLEFSVEKGLVPAPLVDGRPESPSSLKAIWSRPFTSLIPHPVRVALTAERPILASAAILFMLVLLLPQGLFTLYWMTYTWNNPRAADEYRSPREFIEPQISFTALLPARREEDVIKDTIYAVDRINYPDHLKEILILIRDEDDDGTINAAREAISEIGKDNVHLVTFTDGPYNKPNGLNRGLKVATKDVVCIFDAEDEPHPEIYNVVNTVMVREESDVVQSGVQLMNFKSTWFSAFNVLEYFLWFKSGLHAFTREFSVTPLGGNTVFFKRHWLDQIGGWDEGCLTEDGDIGIRLTSLGAKIRIVYEAEHATQEETPDTAESFIKQRTRWCQGFYQIFLKGDWRALPTLRQRLVALYILLNSLLQAAMIVYIPLGLFIALTQKVPVFMAMISYVPIYVLIVQLVINLIGIREFTSAYGEKLPRFFSFRMILYFYPYQLMLSISAVRAVYRMFKGQNAWEKTAHSNLHRQAAAAPTHAGA